MGDILSEDMGNLEIAVEFYPLDASSAQLIKETFADEEIFESSAFTGNDILTVITSAATGTLNNLLAFFSNNRNRYKDAVVKISPKELSLSGYTLKEIEAFINRGAVQEIMKEMKKK